jgi:hypothetical protein
MIPSPKCRACHGVRAEGYGQGVGIALRTEYDMVQMGGVEGKEMRG